MRFRLTRSSNNSGQDRDDNPSQPYVTGAEVVKLEDYSFPGAVQYIEIDNLESLLALVDTNCRIIIHSRGKAFGDGDPGVEDVRAIELYDGYRE